MKTYSSNDEGAELLPYLHTPQAYISVILEHRGGLPLEKLWSCKVSEFGLGVCLNGFTGFIAKDVIASLCRLSQT